MQALMRRALRPARNSTEALSKTRAIAELRRLGEMTPRLRAELEAIVADADTPLTHAHGRAWRMVLQLLEQIDRPAEQAECEFPWGKTRGSVQRIRGAGSISTCCRRWRGCSTGP